MPLFQIVYFVKLINFSLLIQVAIEFYSADGFSYPIAVRDKIIIEFQQKLWLAVPIFFHFYGNKTKSNPYPEFSC